MAGAAPFNAGIAFPSQDLCRLVPKGGKVRSTGFAFANKTGSPESSREIVTHPGKLWISEHHNVDCAGKDSPGPAYNVSSPGAKNSKFRSSGAFGFGSGERTQFAKVSA